MTDRSLSRRTVLKTGAGALAAGAMSGLAGCSSIPIIGGGGGNQGSKELQNWAYDPGELGSRDNYFPRYRNLGSIRDNEDNFDSEYYDGVESGYEQQYAQFLDIDFEDANWDLNLGQFGVLSADHTVEDVVSNLEDQDFEEDESDVSGYTTIVGPNSTQAYAADGSLVLWCRVQEDSSGAIEDFISSQNGEIDMWVDEEEDFAEAVDNVSGDVVGASLRDGEGDVVASGNAAQFNGETTTQLFASVYDDQDDFDKQEIREQAQESDDFSVSFSGRVVIAERDVDTDEYGVSSGGRIGRPQF